MMSIHSSVKQIIGTAWLSFRKNLTVAVTALILMMVTLPVILLMMPVNDMDKTWFNELFTGLVGIATFAISAITLMLSAGLQFSYLHSRPALDVFHALPVRRALLFAGRFIGGWLVVLIPQLLTFAAVLLIRLLPGYGVLDLTLVVRTAPAFMLVSLALYSVSVLAFMLTGTIFDAVFLMLIFNIAGPATHYTIEYFVSKVLPGFAMSNFASLVNLDRYLLLTPLGELLKVAFQPMKLFEVIWWVALIVVMIGGSLLLYQKRKSETAGQPLAYSLPFLIARLLVCIDIGLLFGNLLFITYYTALSFMIGAAVGSLATHTLIEAVLSRGFRRFGRSLISYGAFAILFTIGCLSVAYGFLGYDMRIPTADKVVQIDLVNDSTLYWYGISDPAAVKIITEQDSIEVLINMHEIWLDKMKTLVSKPYSLDTNNQIDNRATNYDDKARLGPTRIAYKLASGQEIIRTVYFDYAREPYASLFDKVQATEEYKRQIYRNIFAENGIPIRLNLYNKAEENIVTLGDELNSQDEKKLIAIREALLKDLLANADEQTGNSPMGRLLIYISFDTGDGGSLTAQNAFMLNEAYTNTLAVLDEYNLLDKLK